MKNMSSRNATASWHGYSHQSKVGILVSLREILRLLNNKEPLDNWKIIFESAEDFDLVNDLEVVSRHQVKAYKNGKYPNDYKDVLKDAYPEVDGKLTRAIPGFQYRSEDDDGNIGNIEVKEDSRYLHTITEVIGFGLSETEFRGIVPNGVKYVENPNKVRLYPYTDSENFCRLSKLAESDIIKKYCVNEIKEILIFKESPFKTMTDIHEGKFRRIIDQLDSQIRKEHLSKQIGNPTLAFSEILNIILDEEGYIESSQQLMRESLMRHWDEYVIEKGEQFDEEILKISNELIQEIYCLEDEAFLETIMHLNPDQGDLHTSYVLTTHLQANSLKDIMYQCLSSITKASFDISYLGYKEGKYTLSLINREPGSIGEVIQKLQENKSYLEKIYERNYLINGQFDNQKIINESITPSDSDENHIMNPEMKFITASNAVKKINGG